MNGDTRHWTIAAGVGLLCVLTVGAVVWNQHRTTVPVPVFVDEPGLIFNIAPAPGYEHDVQAALHLMCGRLERGDSLDRIVDDAYRDGIGGDLYPREAVDAIAEATLAGQCAA